MLMNFQQELNATEQELQRQREENKRYVNLHLDYTDFVVQHFFVLINASEWKLFSYSCLIVAYSLIPFRYSIIFFRCFLSLFVYNNRLVQQHQEVEKRLQELEKQKQPPPQPGQRNLPPTPDQQRLIAEINALKQRLQETGARSENEVEQWRKVVEQEKVACDFFFSLFFLRAMALQEKVFPLASHSCVCFWQSG